MKSDDLVDETAHLVAAGRFLAARHSFGMIWIDSDLVARRRFGALVDFVAVDRPITDSIMATEAVRVSNNIRQLTIAPLMAEAILRISEERSVSSLFD